MPDTSKEVLGLTFLHFWDDDKDLERGVLRVVNGYDANCQRKTSTKGKYIELYPSSSSPYAYEY